MNSHQTQQMLEDVEPLIRPVVVLLLAAGYETVSSCQGGIGHDPSGPYVAVKGKAGDELTDLLNRNNYKVKYYREYSWHEYQYDASGEISGTTLNWYTYMYLEYLQ